MSTRSRWIACAVLCAGGAAHAAEPAIHVPQGAAVVIDGRMNEAEWERAAVQRLPDGTILRLQHDGRYLLLGIEGGKQGFPSVCVAHGESVRVLHASAALGSVAYSRSQGDWTTGENEFVYGMRNTELTEAARAERSEYLSRHAWLASTYRMGDGRAYELQISLSILPEKSGLAVAYFVPAGETGSIVRWPQSLAPGDGCADDKLVRGHVPARLRFKPEQWAELRMEKGPSADRP
jgi:hypothetical protein